MEYPELCAICYDNLTDSTATTQCCQELVCDQCWSNSNALTSLVCGNCSANTTVKTKAFPDVVKSSLAKLTASYTSLLGHTQTKLAQVTSQSHQFDDLSQQMATNMLALLDQYDRADTSSWERDQLSRAVEQQRQASSKSIALSRAQHHQLERQLAARVKYLLKLGRGLNRLKTSLNQVDLAALTQLIQLQYELNSLDQITIPPIPGYQPMRWFNHHLVVDDLEQQFSQAAEGKYRHRTTHSDTIATLERDFDLAGARPSFLVEWPDHCGDHHSTTESNLAYLTCYTSYGTDAFALVDQNGQVVYYRPTIVLMVTKEWLVELIDQANYDNTSSVTTCLQITALGDSLNQSQDYRLNKLVANLVKSLYIPLNCKFSDYPLLDFYQNDLIVLYKLSHNGAWVCQRWCLTDSTAQARLVAELQLTSERPQRILGLNNNTVIVAVDRDDRGNGWPRYYYDQLSNVLQTGTVASRQPLPGQRDEWFGFRDGSILLVNDDHTGQLRRTDPVNFNLALTTIPYQLNQYNTTPWDGRLYQIMLKSEPHHDDNPDGSNWTVIIEFY